MPLAQGELPDSLIKFLVQAFLVLFFLVLPVVRGIREARAKRRQEEQRRGRAAGPADSSEAEELAEARRRWEALLRGEVAAAPEAAPDVPPPVPVQRERAADAVLQPQVAGRISPLPDVPTEDEMEAAATSETADSEHFVEDEEAVALAENQRRLAEERARREAFLRREQEAGAGRREGVAPTAMSSLGLPDALPTASAARARSFAAFRDPAERRAALRQAIVAAELLGSPVALRDPDSGPVGLRRIA